MVLKNYMKLIHIVDVKIPIKDLPTIIDICEFILENDVKIPIKDLPTIIDICEFILENSLLKKYNLESYDCDGYDNIEIGSKTSLK